ncbi:TSC22 domain family protein 2 isoform X2 [Perognathus longimembris pacificus]|uniref:TSC22 domain family protein 2 isoform X2 n=1 Tax=Perognathus longimembris pacificus TaxID=214514 RepID=UPI0020184154|nr:TSC22 domain family protein 2 isoform X2 [Perognathus longimembris pacificus]
MSKMPAKKKSCFQITSVTTAQAASSLAEDTESLDDPDESRTEDVSSEIFDVSRATDFGPEEACERSSSEETLNNVGEAETPGAVSPNLPPDGPAGRGAAPAPAPAPAAAPPPPAAAAAACSSRFRVIKLDHGSGEPYRRGRWTCVEYYERDADGSVLARSADCIRHAGAIEPAAERDSGLGATGGSVVVVLAAGPGARGPDSGADVAPLESAGAAPAPGSLPLPPAAYPPAAPPSSGPSDYRPPPQHVAGRPSPGPAPPAAAAASSLPGEAGAAGGGGFLPSGGLPAAAPGLPSTVPAAGPAPSVPGVPTASVTMPNAPAPPGRPSQPGGLAPAGRGASLAQAPGTHSAPTSLPQADLSQFQTQPLAGPADDARRKSEPLPQPPLSLLAENAPAADSPAQTMQLTPVNSLAGSVFGIAIPVDGDEDSASGGGVVAIDNKIEQAMDLVKSHLMYAVREEVEVLKEQIKELVERNSLLERENALLKSLSNNDQLSQLPAQQANPGSTSQQPAVTAQPPQPAQPPQQPNVSSA